MQVVKPLFKAYTQHLDVLKAQHGVSHELGEVSGDCLKFVANIVAFVQDAPDALDAPTLAEFEQTVTKHYQMDTKHETQKPFRKLEKILNTPIMRSMLQEKIDNAAEDEEVARDRHMTQYLNRIFKYVVKAIVAHLKEAEADYGYAANLSDTVKASNFMDEDGDASNNLHAVFRVTQLALETAGMRSLTATALKE